jgi:deoxyinosine 3'endonuclease (endonuclease V)
VDLIGDSGKIWGTAYRSTNESKNPIIISLGHKISLKTSIQVVKACI